MATEIKQLVTAFFFWWWNHPGTNTDEGFDEWAKTDGKKQIEELQKYSKESYDALAVKNEALSRAAISVNREFDDPEDSRIAFEQLTKAIENNKNYGHEKSN